MWRDLLYAGRSLRHSRTFTLAATAALGLAIGANATIFSLVNGLWLRPAGFANVDRSVRTFSTTETSRFGRWSYPEYVALRDGTVKTSGLVRLDLDVSSRSTGTPRAYSVLSAAKRKSR